VIVSSAWAGARSRIPDSSTPSRRSAFRRQPWCSSRHGPRRRRPRRNHARVPAARATGRTTRPRARTAHGVTVA
jgi:hypothetical protein